MRHWTGLLAALSLSTLASAPAVATAVPAAAPAGWALPANAAADRIDSFSPGAGTSATSTSNPAIFDLADIFDAQLSLGDGGEVVLEFTDNSLAAGERLGVWENGNPEGADFYLGTSATTFYHVGTSVDFIGGPNPLPAPTQFYDVSTVIALHGLPSGTTFSFLKIVSDLGTLGVFDAVGAHGYDLLLAAELVPVPEPGTFVLLGAGAMGLALRRRVRVAR